MRTVALCALRYRESVRKAAGVEPITFPPAAFATFDPSSVGPCDLLYIKLHGIEGQPYLYGNGMLTALGAEQVAAMDLRGAVVFAAVCFLPQAPVLDALFEAGARLVITGDGRNYGGRERMAGADLLGQAVRLAMQAGLPAGAGLALGKARLRLTKARTIRERLARDDALAFRAIDRQ